MTLTALGLVLLAATSVLHLAYSICLQTLVACSMASMPSLAITIRLGRATGASLRRARSR